ncbi:MAG: DUF190 domain-containing protein [Bacteroidetes bacterium]|nr:DUF190 domain-containing protein [Bacteroidota bacterium]
MKLTGEGKLVRIFIGETDKHHHMQLYDTIVKRAREEHLAGATVLRGVEGFGARSVIHKVSLLDLSEDLPMIIEIVDTAEKIEQFLPIIDTLLEEARCGAMVTVEKVDIRKYTAGK